MIDETQSAALLWVLLVVAGMLIAGGIEQLWINRVRRRRESHQQRLARSCERAGRES